MVALCDDNTARFLDVGQRRLIKAVHRPGIGPLSVRGILPALLRVLSVLLCLPRR